MILAFSGSTGTTYDNNNPNPEVVLDECSVMITFWELSDGPLRNAAMTFPVITPERFATIAKNRRAENKKRKEAKKSSNG